MNRSVRVLLLPVWAAVPLAAQAPDQRAALERLRDSIAFNHDTTGLLQLERATIEIARVERDEAIHHLRLGILALRLAELQPETAHLDHAVGEFEWASTLRPDWPWPWYGLGMAEARGKDRAGGFAGGLWTMLGLDRQRLAGQAFARAIAADPGFARGLVEFGRVALEQRIDAPVRPALEALRSATATPLGWDPELLLTRGRLERRAGFPDSALVQFRRAAALSWQPDEALLEVARTRPLTGPIAGDSGAGLRSATHRDYLAVSVSQDPVVVAMLRRDLEPIASRRELDEFDAVAGERRARWLEGFWQARDAVDLREPGSRLAENFRRWDVARRQFRLPPFRRRYRWGIEIYQSQDPELDDRGVIYVRHGEPSLRVEWPRSAPANRVDPLERNLGNESWRYDRPDGTLTLHFVARDDPNDFKVVESPLELDVAIDQLERYAHELPGIARLLRAGEVSAGWVSEEVRRTGRASMAIATQTDSWQRRYRQVLAGRADWFAVGVRAGQPLVHIVYALDAEALRRAAEPGRVVPVRVRAAAFGRDGRVVAQLDTVQELHSPREGVELVASRAELQVAPGPLRVRLSVELDGAHGVVYPLDSLVAPHPRGRTPELSAVLLGRPGHSLSWQAAPGETAWLDAGSGYGQHDTVAVYAEAYGLVPGRSATMTLAITRQRSGISRLLGGRATEVEVSERFVVGATTLSLRRDIALAGLAPGNYALHLRLDLAGRTIERRQGLVVR